MKSASEKTDKEYNSIMECKLALENAPDMVFIQNPSGKIIYANQSAIKESGYSENELWNMDLRYLVSLEDIQFKLITQKEKFLTYKIDYTKKSGEKIPVIVSSSPIIKDGRVEGILHIARNTKDIKKSENYILAQANLNSKLSQITDITEALEEILNTALSISDFDCGGIYVYEDDTNEYELKIHKNLSKEYVDVVYSFTNDSIQAQILKDGNPLFLKDSEYPKEFGEETVNLLINKEKIKSITTIPFFYQNKLIGTLSLGSHSVESISDNSKNVLIILSQSVGGVISRIRSEKYLKESEAKYRQLVELANSIIFKFDSKGKIISMNEYGLSFFGYTKEEIVGFSVYDTITPKIESTGRDLRNLVNDIHTNPKEFGININENLKKNGEKVWVYWSNRPIYDKKGNLTAILAVGNDITEKRNLEETVAYSELKFKSLFENAYEPIIILNNDFLIEDVNKATIDELGYTKDKLAFKMNIFDLASPLEKNRLQHMLFMGFTTSSISFESDFIKSTGNVFPVEISFTKIEVKGEKSIICILRDISEQRKKEEDLKKQLLKYNIEEGNLYLSEGPTNGIPFEAFRENVNIGYKGILISREERGYFDFEDINFEYYWLSKTESTETLPTDLTKLKEFIFNIDSKTVILLDSIDYLLINNGFKELYTFINELREFVYFGKNIIILPIDKNTIDLKQIKLLEKETKSINLKSSEDLDRKLRDILYYILNQNKIGVNPSYSNIGNELKMTRPTVRKNIKYLESNKYVTVHRKGRNKKVELTEKGKNML